MARLNKRYEDYINYQNQKADAAEAQAKAEAHAAQEAKRQIGDTYTDESGDKRIWDGADGRLASDWAQQQAKDKEYESYRETDSQRNIKGEGAQDRALKEMLAAQKQNKDLLDKLQNMERKMRDSKDFDDAWRSGEAGKISAKLAELADKTAGGEKVDQGELSKVGRVYGDMRAGKTLTKDQAPSEDMSGSWYWDKGILKETGKKFTKEFVTQTDEEGKLSKAAMIFRIGAAIATLGHSEAGYIVGGAGYDMDDYVEKGGDSVKEAFRRAGDKGAREYLMGWGMEIGLGAAGKVLGAGGAAVAGKVAEKYPGGYKAVTETVSGWADDAYKTLTKPRTISGISAGADDAATGLGKAATGSKVAGAADDAAGDLTKGGAKGESYGEGLKNKAQAGTEAKTPSPLTKAVNDKGKQMYTPANKPPDLRGMRNDAVAHIQSTAEEFNAVIVTRPVKPSQAKLIESGKAQVKPSPIKNKTSSETDKYLGGPKNAEDLAVHYNPKNPPTLAELRKQTGLKDKELNKLYNEVQERWNVRRNEFKDMQPTLNQLEKAGMIKVENGLIIDAHTGKPFTSDTDHFDFRDAVTGKPLPPELETRLLKRLQAGPADAQHGAHMGFNFKQSAQTRSIDKAILQKHSPQGGEPVVVFAPFLPVSSASYTGGAR